MATRARARDAVVVAIALGRATDAEAMTRARAMLDADVADARVDVLRVGDDGRMTTNAWRRTRDVAVKAAARAAFVLVVCVDGAGTETTRAVQMFLAMTRRDGGRRTGIDVSGTWTPPRRIDCLRANLCFNAVAARLPARRLYPKGVGEDAAAETWREFHARALERATSTVERLDDGGVRAVAEAEATSFGGEDPIQRLALTMSAREFVLQRVGEDAAAETWREFHARALERATSTVERLDDGGVRAVAEAEATSFGGEDPIQRLALTMSEQLEDASARVRAFVAERSRETTATLRDGELARLVESSPERWVDGGYAAHHYVGAPPGAHGVYYELELRDGERVGYIALSAMQSDEAATAAYPFASLDSIFTTAQVDRLCVLPDHRGRGVKEILLRDVCDGFHRALGLAVRVKTAKESVVKSFQSCELLAFERVKDPSANGVAKRRGAKNVVVLPILDQKPRAERWTEDPDDARDYSDWRGAAKDDGRSSADAATQSKRRDESPLAAFTSAINRVTPDNVQCMTSRVRAALVDANALDDFAERLVEAASRGRARYATTFAHLCVEMPDDFQRVVSDRAIAELARASEEDARDIAEFVVELWTRGIVSEGQLCEAIFDGSRPGEDVVRTEIAFRTLMRVSNASLGRLQSARAYVDACAPDGREALKNMGAPTRLVFLAEETHASLSSCADASARRKLFGDRHRATTRAEAHESAKDDVKKLSIALVDEPAAALRGKRKGWVFWYVGSPVRAHDGAEYAFVPGDPTRRFVRVE
ncbi:Acyl-CoA N-acyltransferase [Ostreococcus tauri]|uniref:Acyl-CoA N-acyltransferase n=1 Tax=Ostreococcus tauri TaxID=70448 RepID=A0A096P9I6_OSTTA|nr:Acyl-CoA N-acyltransferase [Ostreococcus tauri]CEG00686.1 Acyl-CoA N-acyltransferase [Ostreococcus tauri]|eukprot:XP_022840521.1 Acyl-CoA N-acyltransferase [Ostreococcus tauri]